MGGHAVEPRTKFVNQCGIHNMRPGKPYTCAAVEITSLCRVQGPVGNRIDIREDTGTEQSQVKECEVAEEGIGRAEFVVQTDCHLVRIAGRGGAGDEVVSYEPAQLTFLSPIRVGHRIQVK